MTHRFIPQNGSSTIPQRHTLDTMASKRRQTVDSWVESVTTEVIDGKNCSAISCLHLKGVGGQTEEVVTKPLEGTINPKELADFIVGRAEGFSQDIGGLQTFKLIAFYGNNEPHNPFHFTTSDGSLMSRSETMMSAHEPTPTGLLGQQMKHIEALIAQNGQLVTTNMTLSSGMMTMCFGPQGIVSQSIRSQLEAVEVVKDAMLDMHKERKELAILEAESAQKLQTHKTVMDAVPHLVNRFTNREIFSEGMNDTKIVEEFALSITPQDLEMLVAVGKISKEKALLLSARFAAIVEEKKKEAEAITKVPPEDSQPKAIAKEGDGFS